MIDCDCAHVAMIDCDCARVAMIDCDCAHVAMIDCDCAHVAVIDCEHVKTAWNCPSTATFILSVRPNGTTWLPLDGLEGNFLLMLCTKSVGTSTSSLKLDKNNRYLTWTHTWCGRKVMRLATLCTNRQWCCLRLHMAVRLTPAVDSLQVWTCYSCYAIVESVWSEVVIVRCVTKWTGRSLSNVVPSNFV